jgi:hypothetical protein
MPLTPDTVTQTSAAGRWRRPLEKDRRHRSQGPGFSTYGWEKLVSEPLIQGISYASSDP